MMFHLLYTFPLIAFLVIINLMVFHLKRDVEVPRWVYFGMTIVSFVPMFNWVVLLLASVFFCDEVIVPSKWYEKVDNWMNNPINPVKK